MSGPWTLVVPASLWNRLSTHLFPGDCDEHGAVLAAGVASSARGARLLVRDVFEAKDAVDYVSSPRAYRMLKTEFIRERILYCRDEKLAYLAVHCHGGTDAVDFSVEDLASHERGYPALRDIARGQIIGGLVLARNAVAGDLWLPDGSRARLTDARIVGANLTRLYPTPPTLLARTDPTYDRQTRLFGDAGQDILRRLKVGVIGAGGVGSLLVEYLARLGVGHLIVTDPERIERTNLPRVVGSSHWWDALTWLTQETRPGWMRRLGERFSSYKVKIAARVARVANPSIKIEPIVGDIVNDTVAQRFTDCDFLFLAADTMQARLVFNALVHQYMIPGIQVGAKVSGNVDTGNIESVFSIVRPVWPGQGCLWCNGLISPARLQEEALSEKERQEQRYVDDPEVKAPSVITLNATAAAYAANEFLFSVIGLKHKTAEHSYLRFFPREGTVSRVFPRNDNACSECGEISESRLGRGDSRSLPTRG